MMINKRLIRTVSQCKKYIGISVALQWISLLLNIVIMASFSLLLGGLIHFEHLFSTKGISPFFTPSRTENVIHGIFGNNPMLIFGIILLTAVVLRIGIIYLSNHLSYLSSKAVKTTLRDKIYKKLLRIGASYNQDVQTSEVVQLAVEGVEQLETYFAGYLPQFFIAMLSPITLFIVLAPFNFIAALVLFICVPLIPVSIAAVQTWAKKLLSKYWGQYTALGDTFLENLQGLTTLKIYKSDAHRHDRMNVEAEHFRVITMKVLTMQLNSIIIMDLVAYGGAALGIIISAAQLAAGNISASVAIFTILISADFFLPMRALGSFFHIAMNGMAASGKIFRLLDTPEDTGRSVSYPANSDIKLDRVHFSYTPERQVLKNVSLEIPKGSFVSIVGESGSGKTTIAALLTLKNKGYLGNIKAGSAELSDITEDSLMKNITYISFNSYLFKGSVKENLLMAKKDATDEEMWQILEKVNLADFLRSENGLETMLQEKAANLSGGQCQRLALARALLHDTPLYIFDEATSNIDMESEEIIMNEVKALKGRKTVILISHRLANVVESDTVYVMQDGEVVESGSHDGLLARNATYARLWNAQQNLENFGIKKEGDAHEK
ncbi:MAG: ABC transporter ATP-binding protein/permease [Bacillota bacterium]|nr:ABC transporter ATP-binding protein/permease [Bacillota bacterium]